MGSEGQKAESVGREFTPLGVDDKGEAVKEGAGTCLADEVQADAGDVGTPNPTGVQQHGAGNQPENERVAKERQDIDAVFGPIEKDLEKYDERENLLTEAYRASEKERKELQELQEVRRKELQEVRRKKLQEVRRKKLQGVWRKRDGISTSNPGESASNPGESASKPLKSDRDTNDDTKSCYIEIKNLVFIDNSVIHKKALEEWDRKQKLFAQRVERKSTKVESRKNEVYQLIGFFSVFQGVVLTAVSQANLLHCNNQWSPILLSLLASIVTIAGVFQKLTQISSLEKTIYSENQALKDVVHRGQALRREGKDFVFAQFSGNKEKQSKEGYSTWYAVGVLSFLLVFTVVFPLSHWRILCHPGPNPYGGAPPPA